MTESNYEQRIEMLRQMLVGYGQEVSSDRLRFYMSVTNVIPLGSIAEAIRSACAGHSGSFPPGPGQIVLAWRSKAEHSSPISEKPRESAARIGPGDVSRQIEGQLGNVWLSNNMDKVRVRAKEIRAEGRYVPKDWTGGNLLAHIKASIELGVDWQLQKETRDRLSSDMGKHEAAGGEAVWWWQECKAPTVTR